MEVLEDIPFDLDAAELQGHLRIEPDSEDADEFRKLVHAAQQVARPKAIYKASYVEARGDETVTVDGVTFTSRALRANLDSVHRVFPFVATCGREVHDIEVAGGDFLKQYWLDVIKAALLGASMRHLNAHLDATYALGKTATMNPGAGDVTVWPIEQQRLLFSLLGDVEARIGVELTDSFLMIPNKSVSGVRFPTEIDFRTCQLCRRENCPSRSAAFDPAAWEAIQHGQEPEP